jgi:hypothetical protein
VSTVGVDEGDPRLAARVAPGFLHVVEEDPDLARVVDPTREVVGGLAWVGEVPGVGAGEIRDLVLGDVRAKGLGVRRPVAQDEQDLVVLDEPLVGRHRAGWLEAVLHADQLDLLAVDAAALVEVRDRVDPALGDVLALVGGRAGEIHEVADLDDPLRRARWDAESDDEQADEEEPDEQVARVAHSALLRSGEWAER